MTEGGVFAVKTTKLIDEETAEAIIDKWRRQGNGKGKQDGET